MNPPRDIIIGIHGIVEAMRNVGRKKYVLYGTDQGIDSLGRLLRLKGIPLGVEVKRREAHGLQDTARRLYEEQGFVYRRVPGGLLLEAEPTPVFGVAWLYGMVDGRDAIRIVCLDATSDVGNIGAVARSAAFFGADALVLSSKKGALRTVPAMVRAASGALEHIPLVAASNLPKLLRSLRDRAVDVVGLSEEAAPFGAELQKTARRCLVLGAEDTGLSHAVSRNVSRMVSLEPRGEIKTLNLSVACAVAMQIFFS